MLPIARHKHDTAALVKCAQPDPVLNVQRLLAHRHDLLLVMSRIKESSQTIVFFLLLRWVRTEPGALLGHDRAVPREEYEDEGIELFEMRRVRRVFV